MRTFTEGTSFLDFKRLSPTAEFPTAFARYVQSMGDAYFWKKGGFHVITSGALAREVLTDNAFSADRGRFFISRMPDMDLNLIGDFFGIVRKMMVMSDGDEHVRRRKLAALGFEDHVLQKFHGTVRKTIQGLLLPLRDKPRVEFMQEVAKVLPSTVLADLFSIPLADRERFFESANTMTAFFGGASAYQNEDGIKVNAAALHLKGYFENLLRLRRSEPGDDYVSILLGSQEQFGLSDDEVVAQLIMMLVAGQVTTTDQIGNIMYLLATDPRLQKQLRQTPQLIPQALEECKRFDPAVTFIFRVATRATTLGQQPIQAGDVIFISTHAVNRDLPQELKPDDLNIHRQSAHFAYGHGSHYCLGAKLGRQQITLLFQEILNQWPPFQLDGLLPAERDHYSLSFSGFKKLGLTLG